MGLVVNPMTVSGLGQCMERCPRLLRSSILTPVRAHQFAGCDRPTSGANPVRKPTIRRILIASTEASVDAFSLMGEPPRKAYPHGHAFLIDHIRAGDGRIPAGVANAMNHQRESRGVPFQLGVR